ncbi:peptidyl-prolyl cis-trans isomerase, cyclophilin-type [Gregarina niphandrodes]|uniref:Peptidyl-prolyl cis-trans isomerase n=1 Tax=Gregarina niphandrodes TaxID=110365 RepID=A0A023B5K1_GRENI|nr:peptidyl-prolyl cis-trans isomerase, cyclophilin-type [Gregarina niphandrodes]EZG61145.1 peptidyl-prolyl cis-trans isomerase, cyclophilin-type [Gregarina niphandrodes]|eukprot:XP_011130798.1 peptidyl-prolyl cis-trans isomerase, cyclophilin-type [Gregarina niphandrodes]
MKFRLAALFGLVACEKQLKPTKSLADGEVSKVVKLDVSLTSDGETTDLGTISLGLFGNELPKTAENFEWACRNHYSDTVLHRVIQGFMAQGGDFTRHNGTGGRSKFGEMFADESFIYLHDYPGALSMANRGPDTNGSQFFMTFTKTPWLDGGHVVFGCVTDGMSTLTKIEARGSRSGKTDGKLTIKSCSVEAAPSNARCSVPRATKSDL